MQGPRAIACLLLMSLMALWSLLVVCDTLLIMTVDQDGPDKNHLTQKLGRRFGLLKDKLDGQHTVGFIIDQPRFYGQGNLDVMIAQYMLAPLVIDHQHDQPTSITNFASDEALQRWLASSDYSLQKRIAEGLAVVERVGP